MHLPSSAWLMMGSALYTRQGGQRQQGRVEVATAAAAAYAAAAVSSKRFMVHLACTMHHATRRRGVCRAMTLSMLRRGDQGQQAGAEAATAAIAAAARRRERVHGASRMHLNCCMAHHRAHLDPSNHSIAAGLSRAEFVHLLLLLLLLLLKERVHFLACAMPHAHAPLPPPLHGRWL